MSAIGRRSWITCALALLVGLAGASRAEAVEPGWAEGQWIGGFDGADGPIYVAAQLEAAADGAWTGALELPLQTDGAITLDRVKMTDTSLHFDVRGEKTVSYTHLTLPTNREV